MEGVERARQAVAEAGITLLGENRAQQLEAKRAAHPDRFRWHFIGQLQSRKVRQILPHVELIHSVASDSALKELGKHGTPETEVLVACDGTQVAALLDGLDPARARRIGEAARARVLDGHTYADRAAQVEALLTAGVAA